MARETFYELLNRATDEARDVQPRYIDFLRNSLNKTGHLDLVTPIPKTKADGIVPALYISDGVLNKFFIIIECKFEQSLENDAFRSGVILQTICYLKQFKLAGEVIPRIALIGNKKQCFVLPVSCLQSYIEKDIVKVTDASNAYSNNPNIVKEIMRDENITKHCHIYDITPDFNMDTVAKEILELAQGNPMKLEIEENSISKVFDYFTMHILKEREVGWNNEKVALPPRVQKDLFMMMLLNPDECYLHPNKKDTALFGQNNQRLVHTSAYIAFKNMYQFKYSLEEKRKFTEICDRLIEDAERRNKGDFYTPTVWVDEAHKLLEKELGENWRDEYIVWDCCCGTKNLTRDYKFRQLYSSTIEEGDIIIGKKYNLSAENYNSVAFQYDFLNEDVELFEALLKKKQSGVELTELDFVDSSLYLKASGLIRGLLKGKPLVFLINPPYGTANNRKSLSGEDAKTGVALTKINLEMKKDNIGASSQQLYAQFVYRICKLKELFGIDIKLGMFSPTLFIAGGSYKGFREYLKDYCELKSGFQFQASQFADVKGNWCISFTFIDFSSKKYIEDCILELRENNAGIGTEVIGKKTLYNLDKFRTCSDWVKEPVKKLKTFDAPQLSSALVCKEKGCGKLAKDALGYFVNVSNSVYKNPTDVYIVNSCSSMGHGVSILSDNFYRVISNFAARKLIIGQYLNWINDKDEYMIPNLDDLRYEEWENDSIIFSLFNTASNQSSLRNVSYADKLWNIKNEFFFMSEQEIKDLANGKYNRDDINDDVAFDIENFGGDRFVYKKLQEINLSEEAQLVLDKAKELVKLSFNSRELFNQMHPEYQINCWDAGWYQIKGLLKEFHKDELEEFNKLYKKLEDKMRPMVYELGFLKK